MTQENSLSLDTLKTFPLLGTLDEETLEELRRSIRIRALGKDEILLLAGEASGQLYFVQSGWLKAEKVSREGRQQTLRFIGPNEIINELAIFSQERSSVTVLAMEKATVFHLSQTVIEALLKNHPAFSRSVIHSLAKRVDHLLNLVENLSLFSVETRAARYLLSEGHEGVVKRPAWQTQSEMAAQLGTVLDVLNRVLQKFQDQGIIHVQREQITILDTDQLRKIASES